MRDNRISQAARDRPRTSNQIWRVVITENVMPGGEGRGKPVWSKTPSGSDPEDIDTFPVVDEDNPDRSFDIYDANDCNCLLYEELAWVRYDADIGRFVPIGSQGLTRHAIATVAVDADDIEEFEISKDNSVLQVADPADLPSGTLTVPIDVRVNAAVAEDEQVLVHYLIGEQSPGGEIVREGQWRVAGKQLGQLFPLALTQTGGSAGSPTTATSWTYTVKDAYTDETLGTTVNPTASPHLYVRESLGKLIAAIAGIGFYNSSGELVILDIREPLDPSEC